MRFIFAMLALSVAMNASAAVYKWTQPDGTVMYSDQPPTKNSAPVKLPSLQEIKMPPPPPSPPSSNNTATNQSGQSQAHTYNKINITQPADNSAFRNNAGVVTVKLDLEPVLQAGDVVDVILDGKEIGQGTSSTLSISNVDRGTHKLQAVVKDDQGNTLISSDTITFTLLRTSILQRHKR